MNREENPYHGILHEYEKLGWIPYFPSELRYLKENDLGEIDNERFCANIVQHLSVHPEEAGRVLEIFFGTTIEEKIRYKINGAKEKAINAFKRLTS